MIKGHLGRLSRDFSEEPILGGVKRKFPYNDLRNIEKIAKIDHFSYNSPFGSQNGLKSLYNIIQCIWGMFGELERLLEAFLVLFINFEQKIDILVENQKIPKIAKNCIFFEKWIFQKLF